MTAPHAPTRERTPIALWNPNAAANWSLLFSPIFGSYLHMLNWRSLGESERAAASQKWFYAGVGLVVLSLLVGFSSDTDFARALGGIFLLSWYFVSARGQAAYVKDKFGTAYVHRRWGKPLGVAAGVLVGVYVIAITLGLILLGVKR